MYGAPDTQEERITGSDGLVGTGKCVWERIHETSIHVCARMPAFTVELHTGVQRRMWKFLPVHEGYGMVVGEQDSDYGTGGMQNGTA